MKERPILFSGNMVHAILDGRKTQTRRVVKLDVHWVNDGAMAVGAKWGGTSTGPCHCFCPHGAPADRLWVRETFRYVDFMYCDTLASCAVEYKDGKRHFARRFGGEEIMSERTGWRPSIHMPRWASRITLEITDVRVERLRDISRADCTAEGIVGLDGAWKKWGTPYANLWNSINASKNPWSSNPWVWAITFRRIEA